MVFKKRDIFDVDVKRISFGESNFWQLEREDTMNYRLSVGEQKGMGVYKDGTRIDPERDWWNMQIGSEYELQDTQGMVMKLRGSRPLTCRGAPSIIWRKEDSVFVVETTG